MNTSPKLIIAGVLLSGMMASCGKDDAVSPDTTKQPVTETTPPLKSFNISYEIPAQVVNTTLTGNTLVMVYTQKINLLVDPTEYERSWSLRLTQDFSNTSLKGFDFYTIAADGTKIYNWADDNLNNNPKIIAGKVDTTVNNKKFIKVKIARPFNFSKVYNNAEEAAAAQNLLIGKKEVVSFSSFYYTDDKTIPAVASTSNIIYQ
jgi:hypothetical protein